MLTLYNSGSERSGSIFGIVRKYDKNSGILNYYNKICFITQYIQS